MSVTILSKNKDTIFIGCSLIFRDGKTIYGVKSNENEKKHLQTVEDHLHIILGDYENEEIAKKVLEDMFNNGNDFYAMPDSMEVRKGVKNITAEEKKEWILKNCTNENGDIDLESLDFSDFKGQIMLHGWKVGGNLLQGYQEVKGDLYQIHQKVNGTLDQRYQKAGCLYQDDLKEDK